MADDDIKILVEDLRHDRENLEKRREALKKREEELVSRLEKASNMTADEAKKILLDEIQSELTAEVAQKIRKSEERIKEDANEKAKEILIDAMKHGATDYVAEFTVSSFVLPNEDVKGRIIGAGGRNIRTFERETGVEIEIDESNEIRLSSFDSVRREIAKRALERLIKDARIQPSRIEEVVKEVKKEVDDIILEEGKRITHECGVYNLPMDLINLIGRYKFRTSYGQNLAIHTIEETKIGISIANEVGANVDIVRLGCLLHDIGKVVTDEEGTHVDVGVSTIKKFGLPKEIIACVAEHHEDKPFSSVESTIVWVADAISGSRPGARYEPHEEYVTRMSKIEEIAGSFSGVDSAMAFQAGRDVRVIVKPDEVDDDKITVLAHEIAQKLEKEAQYAGQIKVTVIREVRASDTTKAH
ncbi:ribonuclease Y [Candidatus Woesebacteria bacterium RBG_19FT_COMBO_47_8]|uniref:Ribonuclease Y n=1 Tax=Candidatus Woesebacteria bacterium RBG_13_46_13 TaxID=1802479 RepID=A0A1F7X5A7_9BACT|nr:MAG: ribonuclease Y [Candidatus Woesebacteria bacterium RBG_13_46_13]OGM16728.1 MAG: ribonuclease Y [Candidatus Woesebacteria bacterium RBG_19FT_COMBO_47_8]HJX59132.1 ribonuclease Y [Patescibacteria group bacterium]